MIQKINLNNKYFEYGTKEVIIIGSAHVSKKNIEQVQNVILEEQPEIIGVELDRNRFVNILKKKQTKTKLTDIFRSRNPFLFLTIYILGNYQKNIAKKLNTTAGGEMISAIKCAKIFISSSPRSQFSSMLTLLDKQI